MTARNPYLQEYSAFARLLPCLEQGALYDAINFSLPLDDPYLHGGKLGAGANATAMATNLGVLLCPSDGAAPDAPTAATNYRSSIGATVWWIGDGTTGHPPASGPFGVDLAATTDGLAHTAAFAEKLVGRLESATFDARTDMAGGFIIPHDLDGSRRECASKTGTPSGFYTTAGLCWAVGSLAQTQYNHGFPPNGPVSDCLLRGVNPPMGLISARSNHPGGVNLALADGSVRFVADGIAPAAWQALGTRAGAEVEDDR